MTEPIEIAGPASLIAAVPQMLRLPLKSLADSVVVIAFDDEHTSLGTLRVNMPPTFERVTEWWHELLGQVARIENTVAIHVIVFSAQPCGEDVRAGGVLGYGAALDNQIDDLAMYMVAEVGTDGYRTNPHDEPQSLDLILLQDPDAEPIPDTTAVTSWPEPSPERVQAFVRHSLAYYVTASQYNQHEYDVTEDILSSIEENSLAAAARLAMITSSEPGLQSTILTTGWGAELGHLLYARQSTEEWDPADDVIVQVLGGGDFPRPNSERIRTTIALLTRACEVMPGHARGQVLTAIAFLYWYLGQMQDAHVTVIAAQQAGAGEGAHMLHHAVDAQKIPEWSLRATPASELGLAWADRVS